MESQMLLLHDGVVFKGEFPGDTLKLIHSEEVFPVEDLDEVS